MFSHIPLDNIKSVIIGNDILFEPSKNTLQDIKSGKSASLNNIACQLFLYLLQNGKEISTRDEILLNVFQHNGARATDANLNQHISSIRKAITTIEHSAEILVTTPRVGFNIVEDSIIFNLRQKLEAKLDKVDATLAASSKKVSKIIGKGAFIVTIALSILAVALTWRLTEHSVPIPMGDISILSTTSWQQCKIHIMGNVKTDSFTEKKALDIFQTMDNNTDCSTKKDIYINIWQSNHQLIDWKFSAECGYNMGYYHCLSKYNYHEQ
ncbi:transcriptional regulator [Pluralibacter gergoviae]|uniref:winged helix-turn-helix domain-containing protein n=1 Tax=Pluralibacter gergoviae TaxID=61647 RepID=UPI0005EC2B4A|nr:winged helix-turn-helix domain-containing protein [Pluralibacter gergoviae]KJM66244.1 transcriptional regulator [Pluralibacter gergoviae]KMK16977.1 transcriptional regulator [Pluralibacter gergoviae]OUR01176.1 transcriptional regulator [Pluralibacter gergoviae]